MNAPQNGGPGARELRSLNKTTMARADGGRRPSSSPVTEVLDFDFIDSTPPRTPGPSAAEDPLPEEPVEFPPATVSTAVRALPHSIEAEEYVLSSVFLDGAETLARCDAAKLNPESFYDAKHQLVFGVMVKLRDKGKPVEIGIVVEELRAMEQLDAIGGFPFLLQISRKAPTTAQSAYFIEKVREYAIRRQAIRAHTEIIQSAYQHSGPVDEFLAMADRRAADVRELAAFGPVWNYRSLTDFSVPPDDSPDALLGKFRFLCRGGGLVIAGPTGIGKSSLDLQSSVCWALGRDFLGIPCTRPLRSLVFQAEDDPGDIGEIWESLAAGMKLTAEEIRLVRNRVLIVEERAEIGDAFLCKLQRAAAGWKKSAEPYDLVRINPLLSFSGCAVADQQQMGRFLRAGLNRVNADKRWAYVLSHHTNKPPSDPKGKPKRNWNEYAYEMSGSAEIANWARAVVAVEPLKEEGRFLLRLAKRGRRAGVMRETKPADDYSPATVEVVTTIYARHATERVQLGPARSMPMIMWLPDSPPEAESDGDSPKRPGPAPKFTFQDIRPALVGQCPSFEKRKTFGVLFRAAEAIDGTIKKATFAKILKDAVEAGLVVKTGDGSGYHLP